MIFRWFFLRLLFRVCFGFGLDFVGMGETVFSLFGVNGVELVCLLKGVEVVGLLVLLAAVDFGLLLGGIVGSLVLVEVLGFVVFVRSLSGEFVGLLVPLFFWYMNLGIGVDSGM